MKTLLKKIMFLVIGQLICVFSLFAQENITIVDTNSSEKTASDSIVIVPFGSAVRKDGVKVSALTEVLRGRVSGLISYQTTGETKKDSTNLFINCGYRKYFHRHENHWGHVPGHSEHEENLSEHVPCR